MKKIARRYVVRGRVQGVGFRWFTQKTAAALGVTGWVRNLDDGRVEAYAVGTAEQLQEFSGRLWKGPHFSEVRGVDEHEEAVQRHSSFRID